MGRTGAALLIGIAIGGFGVLILSRLKQAVESDNPERLLDRLAAQLEELEHRDGSSLNKSSP